MIGKRRLENERGASSLEYSVLIALLILATTIALNSTGIAISDNFITVAQNFGPAEEQLIFQGGGNMGSFSIGGSSNGGPGSFTTSGNLYDGGSDSTSQWGGGDPTFSNRTGNGFFDLYGSDWVTGGSGSASSVSRSR